ncbi:hypothetical protein BSKO_04254 [Bryopsis sp. KO-2023]|nr:hypothetical protein BSKO_04254 [Bryopsis sp. KO-2023]
MASEEAVTTELRKLLALVDPEKTTAKQIRKQLEEVLGTPVKEHKQLILDEVQAFLSEKAAPVEEEKAAKSSKRKARSSGVGGSVEDGGEEDEQPKKMPKLSTDNKLEIQLEKNLFLLVRSYNGHMLIDLRAHYEKDGNYRPGKGVTLNLSEYKAVCEKSEELKEAFEKTDDDFVVDLGSRMRKAKISTYRGTKVDIREYYDKDGEARPTSKGCSFSVSVLDTLTESLAKVIEAWGVEDRPSARPQKKKNPETIGGGSGYQKPLLVVELGPKSRVSVSPWQGSMRVDLREVYEKDGAKLPGKKGISLTLSQWEKLKDEVHAITAAFESSTDGFNVGIGPRRSIRVGAYRGKPFIDIREFYGEEGQEKPGRAGMRFNADTWQRLKDNMEKIDEAIKEDT